MALQRFGFPTRRSAILRLDRALRSRNKKSRNRKKVGAAGKIKRDDSPHSQGDGALTACGASDSFDREQIVAFSRLFCVD